jgi:molybdate transport system regulatory protein
MGSTKTEIQGRLWITKQDHNFIGRGRVELLEKIAQYGSITKAAKAMKMSYKAAWDAVDAMNNLAQEPLVICVSGGKGGGGTRVTGYGHQLITTFRSIEAKHQQFLEQLCQQVEQFDHFYQLMKHINMSTSARNQFIGTVTDIKIGQVSAEVVLKLKGNDYIAATITRSSVDRLGLQAGSEAYVLIKAPHVILVPTDSELEFSARNRLCGKVTRLIEGDTVNAEVVLELAGGNTLKAVVTQEAVTELGIKVGQALCGIIKASHVILAVKKSR